MERLTETNNYIGFMETYLNINCEECQFKNTEECEEYKGECRAVTDFKCFVKNMYSELKNYEDLEKQGKLLKLPCAVGDTIYTINRLSSGKFFIGELEADTFFCALADLEGRFGKNVYFTREEAEVELSKLQN